MNSLGFLINKPFRSRWAVYGFIVWCALCLYLPQGAAAGQNLSKNRNISALVSVPAGQAPVFSDDLSYRDLIRAIDSSLKYYAGLEEDVSFSFGKDTYSLPELTSSLENLREFLRGNPSVSSLNRFLQDQFHIYRSRGQDQKGKVIFSAYYEHSLSASLVRTSKYRYPIYARPPDLVDIEMEIFDAKRKGKRIVGRVEGKSMVPYYTREEIDSGGILKRQGLEIVWAKDLTDILFLQIQGSGWVRIAGSTESYHIRYAGDNGRPYKSVGRYLIRSGKIPKGKFNRKSFVRYMARQPERERQRILNENPRYIFFEMVSSTHSTRGALLVPLTAGRSIASDPKIYPRGALAWIQTLRPVVNEKGALVRSETLSRFVLNQDEGGAIQGAGRIDFFMGGGKEAEQAAQKLWYPGQLYFFVQKDRAH